MHGQSSIDMASATSKGVVLSSAAIIGIAVGGSVLLFVTLSMSIVLAVSLRERHHIVAQCREQGFSSRRLSRTRRGNFQTLHDSSHPNIMETCKPPRAAERYRDYLFWRNSSPRQVPWIGDPISAVHAIRNNSHDRLSSLSWPLPMNGSPSGPPSFGRVKMKPLPPIRMSPVLNSGINSRLAPRKHLSSSVHSPIKSTAQADYKALSSPGRNAQPHARTTKSAVHPADHLESQANFTLSRPQRSRLHDLQRSRSESFTLSQMALEKGRRDTSSGRPGPPPRSVSLHGQLPGRTPEERIPSLPFSAPEAWKPTNDMLFKSMDQRVIPSPASFSSVNSSILNLETPEQTAGTPDQESDVFAISASIANSDQEIPAWRRTSVNETGSPSSKRNSRRSLRHSAFVAFNFGDPNSLRLQYSASIPYIHDEGKAALATFELPGSSPLPTEESSTALGDRGFSPTRKARSTVVLSTPSKRTTQESRRLAPNPNMMLGILDRAASTRSESPKVEVQQITPLQDTSGNQADPFQTRTQPRDLTPAPTDRQSALDANTKRPSSPIKPVSVLKTSGARKKGHRRQNCVRISNLPPIILGPSPCSPIFEEETPSTSSQSRSPYRASGQKGSYSRPLPRPPSTAIFDPQISPTTTRSMDEREAYLNGDLVSPARLPPRSNTRAICGPLDGKSRPHLLDWTAEPSSGSVSAHSSPRGSLSRSGGSSTTSPVTPTRTVRARTLRAVQGYSSPCSPSPGPGLLRPVTAQSSDKTRSLDAIHGPRTPPRIVRSPGTRNLHRSVMAFSRTGSEPDQPFDVSSISIVRKPLNSDTFSATLANGYRINDNGKHFGGEHGSPRGKNYSNSRAAAAAAALTPMSGSLSLPSSFSHRAHPLRHYPLVETIKKSPTRSHDAESQSPPKMGISFRDSTHFEMPCPRPIGTGAGCGAGAGIANVAGGFGSGFGGFGGHGRIISGSGRSGVLSGESGSGSGNGSRNGAIVGLGIHWPIAEELYDHNGFLRS